MRTLHAGIRLVTRSAHSRFGHLSPRQPETSPPPVPPSATTERASERNPPESAAPPGLTITVRRRPIPPQRRYRTHQKGIGVSPAGVHRRGTNHRTSSHRSHPISKRHRTHLLSFWKLKINRRALDACETVDMVRRVVRPLQDAVSACPSRHRTSSLRACSIKAWHRSAPSCRDEHRGWHCCSFAESSVRCRNRGLSQAPDTWP